MQPVSILLDVPSAFRQKAEYGVRMLFLPYRVDVSFIDEPTGGETPDFYYGLDKEAAAKAGVGVVLSTSTQEWFEAAKAEHPPLRHVRIEDQRIPVCFEAAGQWGFDPVATTLFFLSGWQEIVHRTRDQHGRFPFWASVQAQTEARLIPVVDWVRHIVADALSKAGLSLEKRSFGERTWAFCATHDIDYIRKWRPGIWKRELLDRAVLNQAQENARRRMQRARRAVWSLFESGDPFRSALTRIPAELEGRRARGTFFFKAAAHGHHDVHYSLDDPAVHASLERLQRSGHEIGLHPSYHSHTHPTRMGKERDLLSRAVGGRIEAYRAHYLRHDHPASIHHLGAAGFSVDSTLGWASCSGFRYGTCLPFPLFDPVSDQETTVWEVPLVAMESALFNRQNLSLAKATEETRQLMDVCRAFGGVFTGLWHNTLWDEADYPGWGAHFEDALVHASENEARMDTLSAVVADWR